MIEQNFLDALRDRTPQYDSSQPCKRHGTVRRYTKNKGCVVCARETAAKQYMGKVGKIRNLPVKVHVDDVELLESFANQLLENRRCSQK